MRFQFIHAADLHIDSPFAGLGLKDPAVAARFARAGRAAVEALIKQTIDSRAAFLIIAGDIFDGDWKDVSTGLFFARALGALDRAGIPTVIVKGNHDADSVMSRALPYPPSVRVFASNKAETIALDSLGVALHGRSFGTRKAPEGFVASYPARRPGLLNVGVLHTALDGTRGHESYAACTVDDLRRFGYDYWALGHIHAAEIVCKNPWIVYPGNIQGRSIRETGARGAVRVTVEDGRIVEVTPIVLDGARWLQESIDVADCANEADALARIGPALARLHADHAGRPLAIRLSLAGVTAAHAQLVARREALLDDARALGFAVAEDCWVEQVKIATRPLARLAAADGEPDALDLESLLAAAAADPAFAAVVRELANSVADKLPRDLRGQNPFEETDAAERFAAQARDLLTGALGR